MTARPAIDVLPGVPLAHQARFSLAAPTPAGTQRVPTPLAAPQAPPTPLSDPPTPPSDPPTPPSASPRAAGPAAPRWLRADLARLAGSSYVTAQRWARVLDVAARYEGRFLSTSLLLREAGVTEVQWRDACRRIEQHLATHYVARRPPLDHPPEHLKAPGPEVYWGVTPAQAALWRAVREATPVEALAS